MIHVEDGQMQIKGSAEDILCDGLSLVYSLRRSMLKNGKIPFVKVFDSNILAILADKFDDNVSFFKEFDNEDDAKQFRDEYELKKKSSTAENIMRDIWKD